MVNPEFYTDLGVVRVYGFVSCVKLSAFRAELMLQMCAQGRSSLDRSQAGQHGAVPAIRGEGDRLRSGYTGTVGTQELHP